jgi:ribose 5-phosphate isomerase B
MRISVSSDMDEPVARALVAELRGRGHDVVPHGALRSGDDPRWAVCSAAAARDVADGTSEQAVVCCWTGTGASIAANKVAGVRAALCTDAGTAEGARRWNDANVLALSLRLTSEPLLKEILDAWFAAEAGQDAEDRQNLAHVATLDASDAVAPATSAATGASGATDAAPGRGKAHSLGPLRSAPLPRP